MADSTLVYTNTDGLQEEITEDQLFASLDNINLAEVAEVEGPFRFPKGDYRWEVKKMENSIAGAEDDRKAVCNMTLVCAAVHSVADKGLDPNALVGKEHRHTFWFGNNDEDIIEGMGRMRFVLRTAGLVHKAPYAQIKTDNIGSIFDAKITHAKNKNDPEKPYINLDNVRPAGAAQA